jgi:MFS family permease
MFMNNVRRYHLITFLLNLSFTLPIWVIFGTDYLGLTNLQSYWLGTFYWLISAVFEIPTGSWADRFGRKRVFSWGVAVGIATLILFVLTKNFYLLMISQIAAGFAVALKSGPLTSLIYDWLLDQKREKEFLNITSNNLTYLFVGRVIGGALGGIAYTIYPTLPYILLIIADVIVWVIVQGLIESRHLTEEPLSDKVVIRESISNFIRLMKKFDFALVMYASIAFSCLANALWFAYQPYFQRFGFDGKVIGLLYMPLSLASAFGSQIIKRIIPRIHTTWLYTIMLAITGLVGLAMNSLSIWVGMVAIVCLAIIFGFDNPATAAFFQHYYPSKIRATMSSIESLIGSLVLVTASVTTGYFLDQYSLNTLFIFVMCITLTVAGVVGILSVRLPKTLKV